jgi:pimeloyl-ACP methyl ester carboxylesterase
MIWKEASMNRQLLFILIVPILVVTACQPTTLAPTSSPILSPTPAPTNTPSPTPPAWGEGEFVIQVKSRPMIVEVHGHGSIAVIMANTTLGTPYSWHTLVEAADPERYTMVNFKYMIKEQSPARRDATELAAYLEELGYEKIACLGGSLGTLACGALARKPTTVALALMAGFEGADYGTVEIPKLFIAGESDEYYRKDIETQYLSAAEPKVLQIFPSGAHATDLFTSEAGDDVIKVILDFLGEIP